MPMRAPTELTGLHSLAPELGMMIIQWDDSEFCIGQLYTLTWAECRLLDTRQTDIGPAITQVDQTYSLLAPKRLQTF